MSDSTHVIFSTPCQDNLAAPCKREESKAKEENTNNQAADSIWKEHTRT